MPALSHAFFSLSLTDQDFSFRQTSLVSHNAILTLGHMAIVLKDAQQTQQSVLARFQQRLGDPPSPLDILIINQIGCMLISSLVKKRSNKLPFHQCSSLQPQPMYEEIIRLFTEIILDSTNQSYDNNGMLTVNGRDPTKYK